MKHCLDPSPLGRSTATPHSGGGTSPRRGAPCDGEPTDQQANRDELDQVHKRIAGVSRAPRRSRVDGGP
jgi:hypothetical protein